MKKELFLFTIFYPYAEKEPFLENEIPFLCEHFEKVYIVPMLKDPEVRPLPPNAEIIDIDVDLLASASPWQLIKHLGTWLKVIGSVRKYAPSKELLRKQLPSIRSRARQALTRALVLEDSVLKSYDPESQIVYSYWNYDWALSLAILKQINPRVNFVTRMLGYDMYKHRAADNWPPFREFQLEAAERNFIISQAGMDHMNDNYPAFSNQYELSYLATLDHGKAPWKKSDTIRIVSCANLIELKRIPLIAKALGLISAKVHWTHFGGGPDMDLLKEECSALADNIEVDLKGITKNRDILDWYRVHEVDLFIHVSRTEGGVPVALQEAASFGIPLIGTNAGGIPEIVNDITGVLLPLDLKPEVLAKAIEDLAQKLYTDSSIRDDVRAFWAERYLANQVYSEFALRLQNM